MTTPKLAYTDPTDGKRYYENAFYDGRFVSVTTVLGWTLPKQQYFVPWAARLAAEEAAFVVDTLISIPSANGYLDAWQSQRGDTVEVDGWLDMGREAFIKHVKETSRRVTEEAGGLGDEVHTIAEQILDLSGGNADTARELAAKLTMTDEARKRVGHLCDWLADNDVKVVSVEFTVFNEMLGYAGSCDLYAIVNGTPMILDIKTGKDIHAETALQLSAYRHGEYIVDDDGLRKPEPWYLADRIECAALHLQKTQMKVVPLECSDRTWNHFRHQLGTLKYMDAMDEYKRVPTYNSKKARKEREAK